MSRFKLALSIAAVVLLAVTNSYAEDNDTPTIADKNGCKVYNPMPQENETISWSGQCRNGFADGKGILDWIINGQLEERFEGELKMGWADGEGTYVSRTGVRYEGEWKNSLQDGKGKIQNADGSAYEGEWSKGKPNGWGVYRAPNGQELEGEWEDGKFKSESGSRRI